MNNKSKKIIPKSINFINVKVVIISLFLVCFTQASFANESVEKTPEKDGSSKCTTIKMDKNVIIAADSATVYTSDQDKTVIVLPKSDKKNSILLKSDYQECVAEPTNKDHT